MREDPVISMGEQLGHVESIHYANRSAKVYLKFYRPIDLPKDSEIRNFSPSFMGERRIRITLGAAVDRMDPSQLQFGVFEPGTGEQLHETVEVVKLLQEYREYIHSFLYGSDSTPSFIQTYQGLFHSIWQNYNLYHQQLMQMQVRLQQQIQALSHSLPHIAQKTYVLSQQTPVTLQEMQDILSSLQKLHHRPLIEKITQPQGYAIQVAHIKQQLQTLSHLIRSDSVFQGIEYNLHILGKNPSKQKNEHVGLEKP
jgi:hypothetical protein